MDTPIGGFIIGGCIAIAVGIIGICLAFFNKSQNASGGSIHTRDGKNAVPYNYD
jgi:hypothetical protein